MLYAHNDNKKWGQRFVDAARKAGVEAQLFGDPKRVPLESSCFVRVDQQDKQRALSKGVVKELHHRYCKTLPTYQESIWYDDKWLQYLAVDHMMPPTVLCETPQAALAEGRWFGFPLMSKSREGSASKNVRYIRDEAELKKEINQAFGAGIPMTYGRRQVGYLMLQRFIPDNPVDYRIFVTGDEYWGAVRQNRPDVPMASGSGHRSPIIDLNGKKGLAFEYAWKVSKHLKTKWMAYDIVFEGNTPWLLEFSSAWPPHWCPEAPCFKREDAGWAGTGRTGGNMFDIAVEIVNGF